MKIPFPKFRLGSLEIKIKKSKKTICFRCGMGFVPKRQYGVPPKYCSDTCRSDYDNPRVNQMVKSATEGKALQKIGDEHGITKERVRQILSRQSRKIGISIKPQMFRLPKKVTVKCGICDNDILISELTYEGNKKKIFFCSSECRKKYTWVELTCQTCGKKFLRRKSAAKASLRTDRGYRGGIYCSYNCFYPSMRNPNSMRGLYRDFK